MSATHGLCATCVQNHAGAILNFFLGFPWCLLGTTLGRRRRSQGGRKQRCSQNPPHPRLPLPHELWRLLVGPCPFFWSAVSFFRFFLSTNSASSSISSSSTSSSATFALAVELLFFPPFLPLPPPLRNGRKNRRADEPLPFAFPLLSFSSSLGLAALTE